MAELLEQDKKVRKDKIKRFQEQRREHIKEQKEQTPATGVNIIEVGKKKIPPYLVL